MKFSSMPLKDLAVLEKLKDSEQLDLLMHMIPTDSTSGLVSK